MFNKSFGLIATVALTLAPVAAFAGEAQVNSQSARNNATAVGANNTVIQNVDQTSIQDQLDVDAYLHGGDAQTQINKQDAVNSGAAVGVGNTVVQDVDQFSNQVQTDVGF
jgi:hypothetical protein